MDGAALGAMRLAEGKAYTAVLWGTRTGDFTESTQPGGADWGWNTTDDRVVVYAGGIPLLVDGLWSAGSARAAAPPTTTKLASWLRPRRSASARPCSCGSSSSAAGVIGLACAWELTRRDHEVVLLEAATIGGGVSSGNAGWICPALISLLAAPGMVREGIRQLFGGGDAFRLRPRLDPMLVRWLLAFAWSCRRRPYAAGRRSWPELSREPWCSSTRTSTREWSSSCTATGS